MSGNRPASVDPMAASDCRDDGGDPSPQFPYGLATRAVGRRAIGASNIPWSFGIHIFFVISGFIMILTTKNFGEPGAWKRFLSAARLRIVPFYWILTTVMVAGVFLAPRSIEYRATSSGISSIPISSFRCSGAPGDLRSDTRAGLDAQLRNVFLSSRWRWPRCGRAAWASGF